MRQPGFVWGGAMQDPTQGWNPDYDTGAIRSASSLYIEIVNYTDNWQLEK